MDDRRCGRLKNGGTSAVDLVPGEHEVVVICQSPSGRDLQRVCQFATRGGKNFALECGFSMLTVLCLEGAQRLTPCSRLAVHTTPALANLAAVRACLQGEHPDREVQLSSVEEVPQKVE